MPTTLSRRLVTLPILVIEIQEVFDPKQTSGAVISSSCLYTFSLMLQSSITFSIMNSQDSTSLISVVKVVRCKVSSFVSLGAFLGTMAQILHS